MNKNILIIGAGGIGVEIIQNLLYCQINSVTIIDYDTIELSNLSRQFIFQKQDIAQYLKNNSRYKVNVQYYIDSIFNTKIFNLKFYKQFDVVINALDNLKARQQVFKYLYFCNKLQNNILLIDAGTSGLSGNIELQQQFNQKYANLCCRQENKEAIPVCTLRSSPKTFNHCIAFAYAWIKHVLFNENNELNDFQVINKCQNKKQIEQILKQIMNQNYQLPDIKLSNNLQKYQQLNLQDSYTTFYNILYKRKLFNQLNIKNGYDKDNEIVGLLLASISYLRAISFNIQGNFNTSQIQQIANKIVPAISFSNGLVANIACQLMNNPKDQQIFITNSMGINNLIIHDQQETKTYECNFCSQKMMIINEKSVDQLQNILGFPLYVFKDLDFSNTNLLISYEENSIDSGWDDSQSSKDENNIQQKQENNQNTKLLQNDIIYRSQCGQDGQIVYFAISSQEQTQVIQDYENLSETDNSIELSSSISMQ